jgi:hypothetical protein
VDDLHYGMQFHLEIDQASLSEMVDEDEPALLSSGVDPKAFLREAADVLPQAEPVAREIFRRWAGMLR